MANLPDLNGPEAEPSSTSKPEQLIILVHGYGADGNDLFSLGQYFGQIAPGAAIIAPNAPYRCQASPFGFQWYDVWLQDPAERLSAIRSTAAIFDNFIDQQLDRWGLSADKLILIGFSQGTMMSLFAAPRRETSVAGIVGYSGRMESPDLLATEIRSKPPVVLVHGDSDELLAVSEMETAAKTLEENGIPVATHVRPGLGHGIDEEGIRIGVEFVGNALS